MPVIVESSVPSAAAVRTWIPSADLVARAFAPALAIWCGLLLARWIPQYLTWPWFGDHGHFAVLAQLWDSGRLPYRDYYTMQFPGEIYLFWVVGKLFGWGNTVAFWAVDAGFVVAFGALLVAWSVRRLGGALPGLVGFMSFLSYYLGLDYQVAGQRDWHAAFFAMSGLILLDWRGGPWSKLVGALSFAVGMAFRPQIVVLAPALVLILDADARARGASAWRRVSAVVGWSAVIGLGLAAAFLPLAAAGNLDDFLRCLHDLKPGASGYSKFSPFEFLSRLIAKLFEIRFVVVPLLTLLLLGRSARPTRLTALIFLVAVAGSLFYGPISPQQFHNHDIPVMAALAIATALLARMIEEVSANSRTLGTVCLILLVLFVGKKPLFATLTGFYYEDLVLAPHTNERLNVPRWDYGSLDALSILRTGGLPERCPPGRRPTYSYRWEDYRAAILYLRGLDPAVHVDSMLGDIDLAFNGVIRRLPALPADIYSIQAFRHTEAACALALEQRDDTVVLFRRDADHSLHPEIAKVVERLYEPRKTFGPIELWFKKAAKAPAS
jgi:hypothetical protein